MESKPLRSLSSSWLPADTASFPSLSFHLRRSAAEQDFLTMNHYNLKENVFMDFEDLRVSAPIFDRKDAPVICPKPRRVGVVANTPLRPLRWNLSYQDELNDSKAGMELLDIILKKECNVEDQLSNQLASSPPYFCGSPPTRTANPLILDSRFGDEEKLTPISALGIPSPSGMSSPSRKGGCVRMKFGIKPAAVRVEGFDCLNRDRQSSSIPAFA